MKRNEKYLVPERKFAQIVDYDIATADYLVAFRYLRQDIGGVKEVVWLSPGQEWTVRGWWGAQGNSEPLEKMVFSIRKNQLPKEFHFWPNARFEEWGS